MTRPPPQPAPPATADPEPAGAEPTFTVAGVAVVVLLGGLLLYAALATLQTATADRCSAARSYNAVHAAAELIGRLERLPFGGPDVPPPTASQLGELFDDDDDLGSLSLSQLRADRDGTGHTFHGELAGVPGAWTVLVDGDLDGDGRLDGWREGRDDLLRLAILLDGRQLLAGLRAAPPELTRSD